MKVILRNASLKFETSDTSNLITEIFYNKCYNSGSGEGPSSFNDLNATNKVELESSKTYRLSFGNLTNVKLKMGKWLGDTFVSFTSITAPLDIASDNTFDTIAFNISTGALSTVYTVLTREQLDSIRLEEVS